MSVSVLFLGRLADLASRQQADVDAPLDWSALLATVGPQMAEQLGQDRVKIACNGQVLAEKRDLLAQDGDEVALLPPVSGG